MRNDNNNLNLTECFYKNIVTTEGRISEKYMLSFINQFNQKSKIKVNPTSTNQNAPVRFLFTNCQTRLQPQFINEELEELKQNYSGKTFLLIIFSTLDEKQVPLDTLHGDLFTNRFLLLRGLDPDTSEISNFSAAQNIKITGLNANAVSTTSSGTPQNTGKGKSDNVENSNKNKETNKNTETNKNNQFSGLVECYYGDIAVSQGRFSEQYMLSFINQFNQKSKTVKFQPTSKNQNAPVRFLFTNYNGRLQPQLINEELAELKQNYNGKTILLVRYSSLDERQVPLDTLDNNLFTHRFLLQSGMDANTSEIVNFSTAQNIDQKFRETNAFSGQNTEQLQSTVKKSDEKPKNSSNKSGNDQKALSPPPEVPAQKTQDDSSEKSETTGNIVFNFIFPAKKNPPKASLPINAGQNTNQLKLKPSATSDNPEKKTERSSGKSDKGQENSGSVGTAANSHTDRSEQANPEKTTSDPSKKISDVKVNPPKSKEKPIIKIHITHPYYAGQIFAALFSHTKGTPLEDFDLKLTNKDDADLVIDCDQQAVPEDSSDKNKFWVLLTEGGNRLLPCSRDKLMPLCRSFRFDIKYEYKHYYGSEKKFYEGIEEIAREKNSGKNPEKIKIYIESSEFSQQGQIFMELQEKRIFRELNNSYKSIESVNRPELIQSSKEEADVIIECVNKPPLEKKLPSNFKVFLKDKEANLLAETTVYLRPIFSVEEHYKTLLSDLDDQSTISLVRTAENWVQSLPSDKEDVKKENAKEVEGYLQKITENRPSEKFYAAMKNLVHSLAILAEKKESSNKPPINNNNNNNDQNIEPPVKKTPESSSTAASGLGFFSKGWLDYFGLGTNPKLEMQGKIISHLKKLITGVVPNMKFDTTVAVENDTQEGRYKIQFKIGTKLKAEEKAEAFIDTLNKHYPDIAQHFKNEGKGKITFSSEPKIIDEILNAGVPAPVVMLPTRGK